MAKKKFKDTTVGKLLFKVLGPKIPVIGPIIEAATSSGDVIDKIIDSPDLSPEDKAMLRIEVLRLESEQLERDKVAQQEVTKRWTSDNSAGKLTRFIRPSVCILLTILMLFFTYLDSADNIAFHVESKWVDFWSLAYMTVLGGYFIGKSVEKTFRK